MATLLYIHGFLSSPESFKAQKLKQWLQQNRPDISYVCPFLRPYPLEAAHTLEQVVEESGDQALYLVGSSFGGFWATWFGEKYNLPAIVINPATEPHMLEPDYLNIPLNNYHLDETYELTEQHLQQLISFDTPKIKHKENYWLFVQTGDETLDYRLAVKKYAGCKQTVEEGGDHAFQGVERWLPKMVGFLENRSCR